MITTDSAQLTEQKPSFFFFRCLLHQLTWVDAENKLEFFLYRLIRKVRHSVWGDRPWLHNILQNISPETLIILNRVQACWHTEGTKQTQNSVTKLAREWNVASIQNSFCYKRRNIWLIWFSNQSGPRKIIWLSKIVGLRRLKNLFFCI